MEGFDPERGTWETLPQMSTDRAGAAVAALRNQIYVCGVDDDDNNTLSSVERFDPDRSQWEVLPPMNSDRSALSLQRLCVIGCSQLPKFR